MILKLSPPRCVISKESVQQKWINELWIWKQLSTCLFVWTINYNSWAQGRCPGWPPPPLSVGLSVCLVMQSRYVTIIRNETFWDEANLCRFFLYCSFLTVFSLEIQLLERKIVIPITGLTPPHFCACSKITYTTCKHIMTQHNQMN